MGLLQRKSPWNRNKLTLLFKKVTQTAVSKEGHPDSVQVYEINHHYLFP